MMTPLTKENKINILSNEMVIHSKVVFGKFCFKIYSRKLGSEQKCTENKHWHEHGARSRCVHVGGWGVKAVFSTILLHNLLLKTWKQKYTENNHWHEHGARPACVCTGGGFLWVYFASQFAPESLEMIQNCTEVHWREHGVGNGVYVGGGVFPDTVLLHKLLN